jgi:hypothetical protein
MESLEKRLEKAFVKWINSIDGKAVKGPAYQEMGIPDRIAVLPNGGGTVWVEFKSGDDYGLTPMQEEWKELLTSSDPERYFCVDSVELYNELIDKCKTFMLTK